MKSGDTKYCSTLLMYCILARAAAISNQPGLRALALADDAEDDPPYLVRKCVQLLETELDNPGITTAQSLQLLSEMHCAISHDTKGWMYAGKFALPVWNLGCVGVWGVALTAAVIRWCWEAGLRARPAQQQRRTEHQLVGARP